MSLGKETGKREGCSRKQAAEAFQTAYEDGGYAVIIEEDGRKLSMKECMARFGNKNEQLSEYGKKGTARTHGKSGGR